MVSHPFLMAFAGSSLPSGEGEKLCLAHQSCRDLGYAFSSTFTSPVKCHVKLGPLECGQSKHYISKIMV